jgi:hypothetical protein
MFLWAAELIFLCKVTSLLFFSLELSSSIQKYINKQQNTLLIFTMCFTHSFLTTFFRAVWRSFSGWRSYYKNTVVVHCVTVNPQQPNIYCNSVTFNQQQPKLYIFSSVTVTFKLLKLSKYHSFTSVHTVTQLTAILYL